jgi:hypothetical protein
LPLPNVELTEQLMFKLMLAEVALQRGQPQLAVPAYLDLARETRDPRIAQRATEAAWNARMTDQALEAAGIWLQADPGSSRARQVLAHILNSGSRPTLRTSPKASFSSQPCWHAIPTARRCWI